MADRTTRREFLKFAGVGGTTLGFGAFLIGLPPVTAQEAQSQSIHIHPGSCSYRTSYLSDGCLLPIERGER